MAPSWVEIGASLTYLRRLWPTPGEFSGTHWGTIAGKLCARYGIQAAPAKRGLLIGIRGVRPFAAEDHATRSVVDYDDTMVLLCADGVVPPAVFPGSTHAFQLFSKSSPDVNHDGLGDVATILPGHFVLTRKPDKYPLFALTMPNGSGLIPCKRDLNHDGVAETGPSVADSILLHLGFDAPADSVHKFSIGCQTVGLEWMRLIAAEADRCGGTLDYVMDEASEILKLVPIADEVSGVA